MTTATGLLARNVGYQASYRTRDLFLGIPESRISLTQCFPNRLLTARIPQVCGAPCNQHSGGKWPSVVFLNKVRFTRTCLIEGNLRPLFETLHKFSGENDSKGGQRNCCYRKNGRRTAEQPIREISAMDPTKAVPAICSFTSMIVAG